MCGLVGAVGKIDSKIEKVFKLLLQLDVIRGPHSTGILSVNYTGTKHILKKVGTPYELEQYKAYDELFRKTHAVLLGHNRFATQGAVNNINAHPFQCGSITGAHNGTLRTVTNLCDHTKYEVDSENIFHNIDVEGVDATIKKLNGAYALTWVDGKNNTLNLTRNDERPLYYVYTKDNKTVLWASEKWMLIVACDKHGVEISDIVEVRVGHLYSFDIPTCIPNNVQPFKGASIRQLKVAEKPPVKTNLIPFKGGLHDLVGKSVNFYPTGSKVSSYGQTYVECELDDDTRSAVEIRVFIDKSTTLFSEMEDSLDMFTGTVTRYANYSSEKFLVVSPSSVTKIEWDSDTEAEDVFLVNGTLKTAQELTEILSDGCAWCSGTSTIDEYEDIEFLEDGSYLCPHCQESEFVKQVIGRC